MNSQLGADQGERGLRLLSLDGGGIRGLSESIIVEEIMERIKWKKKLDKAPLPSEYFDLIGGTSTGGLLALLLGRLNMSAAESVSAYERLAGYVFSKKKAKGKDGTFKASRLENSIKRELVSKLGQGKEEARMFEAGENQPPCKAFVCAVPTTDVTHPTGPSLFRTYDVERNKEYNCTIWEAARATSAAPTFFKRIDIGPPASKVSYVDAGLGYNNPIKQLIDEAERVFGESRKVDCIVSVGTGQSGSVGYERPDTFQKWLPTTLITALKQIATDSGATAEEMEKRFKKAPGVYYRLDVDRGLKDVSLDEWKKLGAVRQYTKSYMNLQNISQSIDQIVDILISGHGQNITIGKLAGSLEPTVEFKWRVPFPHNERFIQRNDLYSKVSDQLKSVKRPRRCILQGMGGLGKTEMALRIAEEFRPHCHVFWIDCRSELHMTNNYGSIGSELQNKSEKSSIEDVKQLLADRDDWLLIIDNVDEEITLSYVKTKLLPAGTKGRILITGRLASLRTIKTPIEIELLDLSESKQLLKACCPSSDYDGSEAERLVSKLGRLPLAIEQAGNYMDLCSMSVQEYLVEYEKDMANRAALLREGPASAYSLPILQTWEMSLTQVTQDGQYLISILALLRPDEVDESFLSRGVEHNPTTPWASTSSITGFERGSRLPPDHTEFLNSEHTRRSAINSLLRPSLIKRSAKKLSMHPMMRLWSLERLSYSVRRQQAIICLILTTNYLASISDMEFVSTGDYLHYAKPCIENLPLITSDPSALDEKLMAKAYFYLARACWLMLDYKKAALLFEEAKPKSELVFGQLHPWTLWIYNNLGLIYREEGNYEEASRHFSIALAGMLKTFGKDNGETKTARDNYFSTQEILNSPSIINLRASDPEFSDSHFDNMSNMTTDYHSHDPEPSSRNNESSQVTSIPEEAERFYAMLRNETSTIDPTRWQIRTRFKVSSTSIHLRATILVLLGDIEEAFETYKRGIATELKSRGYARESEMTTLVANKDLLQRMLWTQQGSLTGKPLKYLGDVLPIIDKHLPVGSELTRNLISLLDVWQPKKSGVRSHEFHPLGPFDLLNSEKDGIRYALLQAEQLEIYRPIWDNCRWEFHSLILHDPFQILQDSLPAVCSSFIFFNVVFANLLIGEYCQAAELYKAVEQMSCRRGPRTVRDQLRLVSLRRR